MQEKNIVIKYREYGSADELDPGDRELLDSAVDACSGSYSPYSGFRVGAAVRLANGEVLKAANQENAAYPSGLCAERSVLFYAHSRYPGVPVTALAVAAMHNGGLTPEITFPCGACLQVLHETEKRGGGPVRIIAGSAGPVLVADSVSVFLPLAFTNLPV